MNSDSLNGSGEGVATLPAVVRTGRRPPSNAAFRSTKSWSWRSRHGRAHDQDEQVWPGPLLDRRPRRGGLQRRPRPARPQRRGRRLRLPPPTPPRGLSASLSTRNLPIFRSLSWVARVILATGRSHASTTVSRDRPGCRAAACRARPWTPPCCG